MILDDAEHGLRIRWYKLQVDGTQPDLSHDDVRRIAVEKEEVAASMRAIGLEVPPSIDDPEYALPLENRWTSITPSVVPRR